MTEGGMDEMGVFHLIPRMDDARLAKIFAREVLAFLVGEEGFPIIRVSRVTWKY